MHDDSTVPVPFTSFSCGVPSHAIDYNGHMNDAAYAQVLTDANELFLDALGLSADYRERTGNAMYTVEMTIKYLHEVGADDVIAASTQVASADAKRLRVHTALSVGDTDVATGDSLYLHVDTVAGKVTAFPDDRAAVLASAQVHDDEPTSD